MVLPVQTLLCAVLRELSSVYQDNSMGRGEGSSLYNVSMWGGWSWGGVGYGTGFPVGDSQVHYTGIKEENEIAAPGPGFSLGLGDCPELVETEAVLSPAAGGDLVPRAQNKEFEVLISSFPKLSVAPKHALGTENLGGVSVLTASGIIFLGK